MINSSKKVVGTMYLRPILFELWPNSKTLASGPTVPHPPSSVGNFPPIGPKMLKFSDFYYFFISYHDHTKKSMKIKGVLVVILVAGQK